MPEQQNIEYKFSWHDDYLKWMICGFANAQGGQIYIGSSDKIIIDL
jgi:ATP-dependent DNA helicase RecG